MTLYHLFPFAIGRGARTRQSCSNMAALFTDLTICSVVSSDNRWKPAKGRGRHRQSKACANLLNTDRVVVKSRRVVHVCSTFCKSVIAVTQCFIPDNATYLSAPKVLPLGGLLQGIFCTYLVLLLAPMQHQKRTYELQGVYIVQIEMLCDAEQQIVWKVMQIWHFGLAFALFSNARDHHKGSCACLAGRSSWRG